MNINHSIIDLYFAYNRQVGSISALEKAKANFSDYARNAETPEIRERYAQAVMSIEKNHLPEVREQLDMLGKSLSLEDNKIGQSISLEELQRNKTRWTYNHTGSLLSYLDDPTGEFLSTKS